jgi:hypothetical protein
MDKLPKLGNLIDEPVGRDAIHIAIAPVTAGTALNPGDRIGFSDLAHTVKIKKKDAIGIVDPFLTHAVKKGDMFYMFLFPNTITSLRHEWLHPAFEKEDALAETEKTFIALQGDPVAEKWITDFAEKVNCTYSEMLEAAESYLLTGDYLCKGGDLEGEYVPDEFWNMYERIKRTTVKENDRNSFFTCSC